MAWTDRARERVSRKGSVTAVVLIVLVLAAVVYAMFFGPR
jgi:hypothetical protein